MAHSKKVVSKRSDARETGKKTGVVNRSQRFPAIVVTQTSTTLYAFKAKASILYSTLSINRRIEDKDEGYQRALSVGRVQAITRYIAKKNPIPGAIIVAFDSARYDTEKKELVVPAGRDVGWIIDGQHRLAGAAQAARDNVDVELPVVAFLDLGVKEQIEQFITINREAKSVPTSLYLDLLKQLPWKKPSEISKERAADIATLLRRDEDSPFFERVVVTTSPRSGQLSLTNFVRKISPHVVPDKGILGTYLEQEQMAVISNYFKGLQQVYPTEYRAKNSVFFKTVGFGGLWNAFPTLFSLTLKNHGGFRVKDVVAVLTHIEHFDFLAWHQYGSGNQAEINAGDDLKAALLLAFKSEDGVKGSLRV